MNKKGHFRLFQTSEKQTELHCHSCLELNLVEKGTGKYIIGGQIYPIEPGDIFVINNSEHHLAIHDDEELTLTVLVFDTDSVWKNRHGTDYLKPFLHRTGSFSHRIPGTAEGYDRMYLAFDCMKQESAGNRIGGEMVMEAAAYLLLSLLYCHYNEKKEIGQTDNGQYMFGRIRRVFAYINEHFAEEITLDALAEETSMSRTYLCRYFKEMTGQTLFGYIEQTRIQYACYLLKTTERSVAQIAMESGFESVSYFNRMFRRHCNMTPSRYRKGQ